MWAAPSSLQEIELFLTDWLFSLFLKAAAGLWSWGCCTINISGD
jgi:hypothetical protein